MADIESGNNPRLKAAIRLRNGRDRRKRRRFLIDGIREISRAAQAGFSLEEVYVRESAERSSPLQSLLDTLAAPGSTPDTTVLTVAATAFRKLAYGQRDEGVVAVAVAPERTLPDLPASDNQTLVVVLERVEKPGNLGAVFRTAEAAGATALVVADPSTDLFNPNTIRASLGAIFSLPACCTTAHEARDWLLQQQITPFAARVTADRAYSDVDFTGPSAIVLGSEAEGLSDVWQEPFATSVAVPMAGIVDSLNVSVTAGILLFEAVRQRAASREFPKTS